MLKRGRLCHCFLFFQSLLLYAAMSEMTSLHFDFLARSSISLSYFQLTDSNTYVADLVCDGFMLSIKRNHENISFSIDRKCDTLMFRSLFETYPISIPWVVFNYFEATKLLEARKKFFSFCTDRFGGRTDKKDLHQATTICIRPNSWMKLFVVWKIEVVAGVAKSQVFLLHACSPATKNLRNLAKTFEFLSSNYSITFAIKAIMKSLK